MHTCIKCDSELEESAKFCDECGAAVQMEVIESETNSNISEKITGMPENNLEINEPNKARKQGITEFGNLVDHKMEVIKGKKTFISDCKHFLLEWNQGTSVFLTNAMSGFNFRITPLSSDAELAENFIFFLRFPGHKEYNKRKLPFRRLTFSRPVHVNYRPKTGDMGIGQGVDLIFSYTLNGENYYFAQQIAIDIYPHSESNEKVLENLTIKIGDINQEGKAGDPSLNILKGLYKADTSFFDLIEKLKKTDLWVKLELFQAIPPDSETIIKKLEIPPAPKASCEELTAVINGDFELLLFRNEIVIGRDRKADLVFRNEPPEGEKWTHQKLCEMNLSVSKFHCKMSIDENGIGIADNNSQNGTFLDGVRIDDIPEYLGHQTDYNISLASPEIAPGNISFSVRVYQNTWESHSSNSDSDVETSGAVIKQTNIENRAAMIVCKRLPLSSVLSNAGNLFIVYRGNNFAVTNGIDWKWLTASSVVEIAGITIETKN